MSNSLQRHDPRGLLARILDTPQLARVVPRLQPDVLHRVIQTCGLEDCGEILALATPGQLSNLFDLDLWRAPQPGWDEALDADRFGIWLHVLMEAGAAAAAEKVVGLDAEVVIAALAQHLRVFDVGAVALRELDDGEELFEGYAAQVGDGQSCEIGGYVIAAKRIEVWDTIIALLMCLDEEHPDYFTQVMAGCRRLSNSKPEEDGFYELLDDDEQDLFDLSVDRERRREQKGYVTPAQARAFLHEARQLRLGDGTLPARSPIVDAYFRSIAAEPVAPPASAPASEEPAPASEEPAPAAEDSAVAAVMELLIDAGVLPQPPRVLLEASKEAGASRLAFIEAHMRVVHDRDADVYAKRTDELVFLANTLIGGCSIQDRPFTPKEASDAVAAICNLGLQNWPRHAGQPIADDFLLRHDLLSAFQIGWTVLYADVCLHAAERLLDVLRELRSEDRQTQAALDDLRRDLTRQTRSGQPWRARLEFDVLALFDLPAWAALLAVIDEYPVLHAAITTTSGSINAAAFEMIADNSQIALIHNYLRSLDDKLRS